MNSLHLSDRVGISTNLYLEETNILAMIEHMAEKFKFVEVELEGKLRELTDDVKNFEVAHGIRKIAEKTGAVINLHAPYIRIDYILGKDQEAARDVILRSAEFAILCGSRSMTFHPGFRFPSNAPKADRAEAIGKIQELAYDLFHVNKHKGANLIYCLENSGNERPFLTLTHEENDNLFTTSPLSMTLDMAHAASWCTDRKQVSPEIKRLARYAANVHLADINFPKHLHLPLGQGDYDYHAQVMAIESTGYTGPYIVEEIGAGFSGDEYLNAALEYRAFLRSEGAAPSKSVQEEALA